jgi:mRNA interferase MazF
MTLMYHPAPGEVLLYNYNTGFISPEMIKIRPVIVVSPRLRRRDNLVAVVPLSTTEPNPLEPHQCEIELAVLLPPLFHATKMWAKCDMLATVSRARLDRFRAGRQQGMGARSYVSGQISAEQLISVRKSILCGLGLT